MKLNQCMHLAKENFKFSSAHFLIFDKTSAEMLHGHNYRVFLDLEFSKNQPDKQIDDQVEKLGYTVDFNDIKKYVKAELDLWDEHILLPKNHPDLHFNESQNKKNYEINFRDRFYSFPQKEVLFLDIDNTSVENLSFLLVHKFYNEFKKYGIVRLTVKVEETLGQSASTTLRQ